MSNFREEMNFTQSMIETRIMGLASDAPVTAPYTGVRYADLETSRRYAQFCKLINEPVAADLTHLEYQHPASTLYKITGLFEDGVDVASQIIMQGTRAIRAELPFVSQEETVGILSNSFDATIAKLMAATTEGATPVERDYGLGRRFLTLGVPPKTLLLRNNEYLELDEASQEFLGLHQGKCPFGPERMRPIYRTMVAAAAKIDWLLPLDFERIDVAA